MTCAMLSSLLFGFSRSLKWAIVSRAFSGASNGNVVRSYRHSSVPKSSGSIVLSASKSHNSRSVSIKPDCQKAIDVDSDFCIMDSSEMFVEKDRTNGKTVVFSILPRFSP